MEQMAFGAFQTACEASPHKTQIDQWLNEGKSNMWISRELKTQFMEMISDKSVSKYRKYREEFIQKQLEQNPDYQHKMTMLNQQLVDGIGEIKQIDVLSRLSEVIDQSAGMLADARDRDIQIKNAQDMRFISQTMLDAIKIYGDTVLKAQRFNKVEENPELLKPTTISLDVKGALTDILKEVMNDGTNGYQLIDRLRSGVGVSVGAGTEGNTCISRPSDMDGNEENT